MSDPIETIIVHTRPTPKDIKEAAIRIRQQIGRELLERTSEIGFHEYSDYFITADDILEVCKTGVSDEQERTD